MEQDRQFGTIIRERREELRRNNPDFSLRKFAAAVGLSPTFLSKIENNDCAPPKAEKVIAIAERLGLDPTVLLAKAQKLDPELRRIVTEHQHELVTFLRTVDGKSSAVIQQMTEAAVKHVHVMRPIEHDDGTNSTEEKEDGVHSPADN